MRKMFYLFLTVCCIFLFNSTFAQSTTVFLRAVDYNNVKLNGGSTAVGHLNDIELFSYSQGVSACTTAIPCPAVISDFTFMMMLNSASVTAKQMILKGEKLKKVDVYYRKSLVTFDYYNIHMEDVTITTVQESGSSEVPIISMSLSPAKIAWQYTAQKTDGTAGTKTKTGWDFNTNTEWIYVFP